VISAAFPYQKQQRWVLGSEMAYVEEGKGDPIVLLHGSYFVVPLAQRVAGWDHWDKMGSAPPDKSDRVPIGAENKTMEKVDASTGTV
jgi:hypothetical protein